MNRHLARWGVRDPYGGVGWTRAERLHLAIGAALLLIDLIARLVDGSWFGLWLFARGWLHLVVPVLWAIMLIDDRHQDALHLMLIAVAVWLLT